MERKIVCPECGSSKADFENVSNNEYDSEFSFNVSYCYCRNCGLMYSPDYEEYYNGFSVI